jgi:hypothetical protein
VTQLQHGAFGGCDCMPRISDSGGSLSFGLELCACCDECDCVDPGYEASREVGPLPSGIYEVVIPEGLPTLIQVVAPGSCDSMPIADVRVVGPDEMLVHGGPRLWWARVVFEQSLCCSAPAPAVEQGIGPTGEIVLSLASCIREDCLCDPPPPMLHQTWHSLGELDPGTYSLVAGSRRTTFTVP